MKRLLEERLLDKKRPEVYEHRLIRSQSSSEARSESAARTTNGYSQAETTARTTNGYRQAEGASRAVTGVGIPGVSARPFAAGSSGPPERAMSESQAELAARTTNGYSNTPAAPASAGDPGVSRKGRERSSGNQ